MYNDIPPDLLEIIEPVAQQHGLEVVDALVSPGRGRALVRIVLDTQAGDGRVTVGQCATVSREIEHGIDAAGLIPGSYMLEVSSPGVDRTLGREQDFARAVGRKVEVQTRQELEGRHRFRGELLAFEAREVRVRTDAGEFQIPFDQISKAQAFYPFDAPQPKR